MSQEFHLSEDELHGIVDGRLGAERRAKAEAHLAGCSACRGDYESLVWVKGLVATTHHELDVPPDLERSIREALDREDLRHGGARWRGALAVAASVVLAGLALTWWFGRAADDLPTAVGRAYADVRSGKLQLGVSTTSVPEVEAFFRREGVTFRTRVIDLAMMSYRVRGGTVHRLAGRPSALFVYDGAGGKVLVCQMYAGRVEDLAPSAEVRSHRGFDFHIYRRGALTLVFWQEGEVVCVLAGDFDAQEVIQLAFEKAML